MYAVNLKTNHLTNPIGIDADGLFLSWTCAGGIRQTAYRIRMLQADETVWDSGIVKTNEMHAQCPLQIGSWTRIGWTVQLWDENGETQEPAEAAYFETGLKQEDWQAKWVAPELFLLTTADCDCRDAINAFAKQHFEEKQAQKEEAQREEYIPHQPASYLRKVFSAEAPGESARLYITACGLYEAHLNGQRVGNMVLAPGAWTADQHLGVQTYDVSELLQDGENVLEILLGDGWYRSTSGVDGDRNLFGEKIGVLFQLQAGGEILCISDEEMEASQSGPIRQNDMQQGEVYDARMEEITDWHGVSVMQDAGLKLCGMNSVPILEQETFAGRLFTAPNGETVLDFGQNLAGYVEMNVTAHAGQQILLTCGEALDADGNFTNENFQDRNRHKEGGTQQYLQLICKEGENYFKPHFTIMGFRYAKVETDLDPADLENARFTAHAVYSDMPETGQFRCSNEDVNQLVRNSLRSMKSNFCDVPTDCPTRERAAWTGDMGVFADTGLYLMDCYPVIEKWLGECRLSQYPDGRMANIAPPNGKASPVTALLCGSAGWGDACIIVPWTLYQRYGDLRILKENYEMMQKWYAFLLGRARQTTPEQCGGPYAEYTVLNGFDYGEWCEPDVSNMAALRSPRKSVGTAYLAYSGKILSQIAAVLGEADDAAQYLEISRKACAAYRDSFTEDGVIHSGRQAEYVRAIRFGLLSEEEAGQAAAQLNRMIIENGYHLNTGFLSTPFLCGVLCDYGYTDTAYRLLLQEEAPGWLYAVKKGATSIWETWEGIDAQGQPHESLNHYSYGAVCGWLFRDVCGISVAGTDVRIAPTPDPHLSYAQASYDSPLGRIESGWRYEGETIVYEIRIPANVTAQIILPDGRKETVSCGSYTFGSKCSR